jgi:hypothetical protein
MDDQPDAPLVAITKFTIHLLARVRALETLLVQKNLATKQEVEAAIAQAERGLDIAVRSIRRPNEQDFEPALREVLQRLKGW